MQSVPMKNTLTELSKTVSSVSHTLSRERSISEKTKRDLAERMGLDLYSAKGSFTLTVGTHKDLPGVIVKVVRDGDEYLTFARERLAGRVKSKHFPEVYAVTTVGDLHVILVEQIDGEEFDDTEKEHRQDRRTLQRFALAPGLSEGHSDELKRFADEMAYFADEFGLTDDIHDGNLRYRKDGTLVLFDPIW